MGSLLQDLRFGLRMLVKTPVVSGIAALSLAVGIAANMAMFALLDGFLLSPLPFADQHELVMVRELEEGRSVEWAAGVAAPNLRDYLAASDVAESAAFYTTERSNLTGMDRPEQLQVVVGSPDLLQVLGVQPALGRGFRLEEGAPGNRGVVVLEHDFWERRFLSDPEVLGTAVQLDGSPYTIVGVLPADFDMVPADVQAVRPSDFREREDRGAHDLLAFVRLPEGSGAEDLRRELEPVSARLSAEFPDGKRGWKVLVQDISDFFPGATDRALVLLLTAVSLFGLLIACANVANLLLGRAEIRQKEVAVRTALGAGRGRIIRQLLVESVTLALVAGGVGVGLGYYLVAWLQGAMPPQMPASMEPQVTPLVVLVTVGVSLLAGVAFGLAPALHATASSLAGALGGARGGSSSRAARRVRSAFVVGEFAVALALLCGAGFLVEGFQELTRTDAGYDAERLLTFQISVLQDRYPDGEAQAAYQEELLRTLGELPEVSSVALMSSLPRGQRNPRTAYRADGVTLEDEELPRADFQVVNAGYFEAMGLQVLEGRALHETDRAEGEPVVVVSRAVADASFPAGDPLGRSMEVAGESRRIVGVVEEALLARIGLEGGEGGAIYLPYLQGPRSDPSFALAVRSGDPARLAADVREAVWSVEADQPVASLRTLEAHIAESLAGPRSISLFLIGMGAVALILAAMGIYGVMAHSVARQRREIGIRMALGAERGRVVRMVTRHGLGLAGLGMLLGLPLAWLMYRGVMQALDIFAGDVGLGYVFWLTGALMAVAAVSAWLPARRASGVSPVTALRED